MKQIIIPFSGLYGSVHDEYIDDRLTEYLEQSELHIHDVNIDFKKTYENYAKEYTNKLSSLLDIDMIFNKIISPREYNFDTDRICVTVNNIDKLQNIYDELLNNQDFKYFIKDELSPRSGFIPLHSCDISTWTNSIVDLEPILIQLVLEFWLIDNFGENWEITQIEITDADIELA